MAKAKKAKKGEVTISFVGDIIDRAVGELEKRMASLPPLAPDARKAVKFAIASLKFTAAATKLHCKGTWFMSPK